MATIVLERIGNINPDEELRAVHQRVYEALKAEEGLALSPEELKTLFPNTERMFFNSLSSKCRYLLELMTDMGHTNPKLRVEYGEAAEELLNLGFAKVLRQTEDRIDLEPTQLGYKIARA